MVLAFRVGDQWQDIDLADVIDLRCQRVQFLVDHLTAKLVRDDATGAHSILIQARAIA